MKTIYLAGPDVFYPNAEEVFARKKEICATHGFRGLAPLDNDIIDPALGPQETAASIYTANEAAMRAADACIANITPFRGAGADVGTVFEVGFMLALGKPVSAYTSVASDYYSRVAGGGQVTHGATHDHDGLLIENFGLVENLMVPCSIETHGGIVAVHAVDDPHGGSDLTGFEKALVHLADQMG